MVNADSREKVRQALQAEVSWEEKLVLPDEIRSTSQADIYPVIDAFERKHAPIANYFCSGAGIDLQYEESQMAEQVMLHFAKQGIPCLAYS